MKSGTLEAAQISSQGEALIKLSEKVNESRQKLAIVKATYGANHPEYKKAAYDVAEMQRQFEDLRRNIAGRIDADYNQARNREVMLKHSVEETKNEFDGLNTRSFQYQQLKREAEGDKKLYDELNRKIQEAGINAGFQNKSAMIRIADEAESSGESGVPKPEIESAACDAVCDAGGCRGGGVDRYARQYSARSGADQPHAEHRCGGDTAGGEGH